MNKKNLILFLITSLLFNSGCSSPKFYKEVKSLYNKQKLVRYNTKNDINKELFRKLENKLSESNHIIYYYQPDYSTSDKNFKGIIYDIENGIYFYIKGLSINNIIIDTIPNSTYSEYELENINIFMNNQTEELTSRGENCDYSGINIYDNIYEINLEKKTKNKFYFKNYYYCSDSFIR